MGVSCLPTYIFQVIEKATDNFFSLLAILLSHCVTLFVTIHSLTITNAESLSYAVCHNTFYYYY